MSTYKNRVTRKNCFTCQLNMGVCAGHGKINDEKDTYGLNIEETIKLFPNGCDDYEISFESFIEEEEYIEKIMEKNWMERMKDINSYEGFEKLELYGYEIQEMFKKYNEKYGNHYSKTRKTNLDIKKKFPQLEMNEKYRLLIERDCWENIFCGIFELNEDNNLGFFACVDKMKK